MSFFKELTKLGQAAVASAALRKAQKKAALNPQAAQDKAAKAEEDCTPCAASARLNATKAALMGQSQNTEG